MYPGSNHFEQRLADPFAAPAPFGPPASSGYGPPLGPRFAHQPGGPFGVPPRAGYNTLAALSPVLAVVMPPAGIAVGHMALAQIKRTGERGRSAGIAGLVIGYLMVVALLAVGIWWLVKDSGPGPAASTTTTVSMVPATPRAQPSQSAVTSVDPPSTEPRGKIDLATVPTGTCVEISPSSSGDSTALELYAVDCEHKEGVYTVISRVDQISQCQSAYAAAPPDHSFAVCMDKY